MQLHRAVVVALAAGAVVIVIAVSSAPSRPSAPAPSAALMPLPSPVVRGSMSVEEALATRRSVREYSGEALTTAEIGRLLWAAQGVTSFDGRRTAPSAGATYPLELLAATPDGVYRYVPADHGLRAVLSGDVRGDLARAAAEQAFVGEAPLLIVVAAVPARTEARYGDRAERYIALEAGHAAQNVLLEAVALGLGAVPVGSFDDAAVSRIVGLAPDEAPLYLLPVGHPR
jgi:SagB-type dehydrogenase family enzyme